MDPAAFRVGYHALGAENDAVFLFVVELRQDLPDLILRIPGRCLHAPADEDLIRVVSAVVMMMVMMVVGSVDPVALFIDDHFRVLMVMIMVVMMLMLIFVIVVMMVVVMMLVLIFVIIVVVMVVVMLVLVLVVVMVVMVLVLIFIP